MLLDNRDIFVLVVNGAQLLEWYDCDKLLDIIRRARE